MIRSDYHVHTVFCDGKNTPEEMAEAALARGMETLGFSGHSYTFFDESYCIPKEKMSQYRNTVAALKEQYRGKLRILCGIEQDLYATEPTEGYDYVIGSVHYLKAGEAYIPLDETAALLQKTIDELFQGDALALAEAYFASVARLAAGKPTIVGHLDLLTKFNEQKALFDTAHPRYLAAARKAMDALLDVKAIFEINTGAMARRYRTTPYPEDGLLTYIVQNGGRVILSSDAHSKEGLLYAFEKGEALARACGVQTLVQL